MLAVIFVICTIGIALLCLKAFLRPKTEEIEIIEDDKKIKNLVLKYEKDLKECYTTLIENDYVRIRYVVTLKRDLHNLNEVKEESRKVDEIVHFIKL